MELGVHTWWFCGGHDPSLLTKYELRTPTENMGITFFSFFIIKKSFLNNMLDKIFYGYGDFYIRLLFYMQKKNLRIRLRVFRRRKNGKT